MKTKDFKGPNHTSMYYKTKKFLLCKTQRVKEFSFYVPLG